MILTKKSESVIYHVAKVVLTKNYKLKKAHAMLLASVRDKNIKSKSYKIVLYSFLYFHFCS